MRLKGVTTLKKRKCFLFARNNGTFIGGFGLFLQVVKEPYGAPADGTIRVGFTVSKKVGKAVVRNKVKRRFRILARDVLAKHASKEYYYILIGNRYTPKVSFKEMSLRLVRYLSTARLYS
ncbi:ribonuclease P protein component [Ehrlichia minasensis]|uniref:Ribonuclease P protein component n=1 Tax=Ehrlichia minasensis TaxID=1242993 RepID=A0A4Q6I8Q5_9RICK|nr:ribonuclease P protein component [Ehrlichia minasensis]RZB13116.1 ribonuclease P protein component [Ehrlichia minasensis]CEI85272.1 Ribonuclease P protein component (RNase P protein) (RNaseP protein) (Protein C5) [Ehrlichia minasensis]